MHNTWGGWRPLPGAPNSFLFLVAMPGAPCSILAPAPPREKVLVAFFATNFS